MAHTRTDTITAEEAEDLAYQIPEFRPVDMRGIALLLNQELRAVRNWVDASDRADNPSRLVLGKFFPEPKVRPDGTTHKRGRYWDAEEIIDWGLMVGIVSKPRER